MPFAPVKEPSAPVKEPRPIESIDSRQLESLRAFHKVASALASNLDLDSILRTIVAQMEPFFGTGQWSLLLLDEEKRELYYALSAGIDEDVLREVRLPVGEGIAGHVAASGHPLSVPAPAHGVPAIACLPVLRGDRTLAVLQLHDAHLDRLPESSASFLRVLCDYAGIALENARQVKLIHQLSITDDCTGLYNARHLYEMLGQEIAGLAAAASTRVVSIQPGHFSLLFLDLDRFKSINDTHGHLIGSALLAEIGVVIKRTLGPAHDAFRYGGDEFVALLRGLDKAAATELAERLRTELLSTSFLTASGLDLHITGSFGLATFPQDGDNLQDIVRAADTMMYAAKANGRNYLAVADPANPATLSPIKNSRHS